MNGRAVGRSPARAQVMAYETVKVTATLAGHKAWTKAVYVRGKDFKVSTSLMPAAGRKAAAGEPAPSAPKAGRVRFSDPQ